MTHCAVLIVNWQSWALLSRCLETLAKQTYRNFKVFVADNASDEPPPEGIFSILPGIEFIQNDRNYGFAAANNLLLKRPVDSEWVVLLNPDAFPEPEWLEQLVHAAQQYPDYSFFSSRLLSDDNPEILDGDGDAYHLSGLAWRNGNGKPVSGDTAPSEVFSSCAAASMYRTTMILEAGGFDEDFFCYFEDVDLGFRLRLAGYRCLLVPSARVRHVGSATSGGQESNFSLYHGHRNLVWTYVKNMPAPLFWPFLPYHLILNIVSLGKSVLQGNGKIVLKAKCDAMRGISKMWRKRRAIQANRVAPLGDIWRLMDKQLLPVTKHN